MHMEPGAQIAHKQGLLLAEFSAQGLSPERVLEPLRAEPWGYRRRARLSAANPVLPHIRNDWQSFIDDLPATTDDDFSAAESS